MKRVVGAWVCSLFCGCSYTSTPGGEGDGVGGDADADSDADEPVCMDDFALVGVIDGPVPDMAGYGPDHFHFDVGDDLAFVNLDIDGFDIVDLSDPTAPETIGTFPEQNQSWGGLAYSAPYLLTQGEAGGDPPYTFFVFDVSDPASPVRLSSLGVGRPGRGVTLLGGDRALACQGGDTDASLDVIDYADPALPVIVASLPNHEVRDVALFGATAFLSVQHGWDAPEGESNQQLEALDLSDPAAPAVLVSESVGDLGRLAAAGTSLVAGIGTDLVVFDVSDPAAPREVGRLEGLFDEQASVLTSASTFVLAAEGTRLTVVDVAIPEAPERGASIDLPGEVTSVLVSDTYGYVMIDDASIRIFDLGC